MRICHIFVIAVLIIGLGSACHRDKIDFSKVETYMLTDTARMKQQLQALKPLMKNASTGDSMKYALLEKFARLKTFGTEERDADVQKAIVWFDRHGSKEDRVLSYYVTGCIYNDHGRLPEAIDCALTALELAEGTGDTVMQRHLCSQLGYMYELLRLYDKALPMHRRTLALCQAQPDLKSLQTAYYDLGRTYAVMGRQDSALHYFKKCADMADKHPTEQWSETSWLQYAGELISIGRSDEALKYLKKIKKPLAHDAVLRGVSALVWADYFRTKGNLNEAERRLTSVVGTANDLQRFNIYDMLGGIYMKTGQYEKAAKAKDSLYACQIRLESHFYGRVFSHVDMLHKYRKQYEDNRRLTLSRIMLWSVVAALLVLTALLYALYVHLRSKHKDGVRLLKEKVARLNDTTFTISVVTKQLNDAQAKLSALARQKSKLEESVGRNVHELEQMHRLFDEQTERMRMLEHQLVVLNMADSNLTDAQAYQKVVLNNLLQESVYKHFKELAATGKPPLDQDWEYLKLTVDKHFPNFVQRLYMLWPDLKPIDFRICLLEKLHMTAAEMQTLLQRVRSTIHEKRRTLLFLLTGKNGKVEELTDFLGKL